MKHLLTFSLFAIIQLGWAQSEYCLDGTVWDATLGGCVPEPDCLLASDLNGDGEVGAGDLLLFLTEFGGSFPDADADGICDDNDDCVGEVDECGVCNGPGPTIEVILDITILYDSVYADQIDEWIVFEVGTDTTFTYTCAPFFGDCGDPVSYQGYDYATVLIGEQCWFAENLRSENYENGDAIPTSLSDSDWQNTTSGAVAVYGEGGSPCENDSINGLACDEAWSLNEYGRLYNWYAVDDARGLCPSGWHVPTDGEWITMAMALGMTEAEANSTGLRGTDQGSQMKVDYGWYSGGNGTNSSGFGGLPGGGREVDGEFIAASQYGGWHSSTLDDSGPEAWYHYLGYDAEGVYRAFYNAALGLSIRCIKDTE